MLDTSYLIYHTQNQPPSIESCENLQSVPRTSQRGSSKPQTEILRGLILLCTVVYCFGSPSISPHDWNMPQSLQFQIQHVLERTRCVFVGDCLKGTTARDTPGQRSRETHFFKFNLDPLQPSVLFRLGAEPRSQNQIHSHRMYFYIPHEQDWRKWEIWAELRHG